MSADGKIRPQEGEFHFSGIGTMVATGASGWSAGGTNQSTVQGKLSVYQQHLEAVFGHKHLDEIQGGGDRQRFRASLVEKGLTDKTINNILTILLEAAALRSRRRLDRQGAQRLVFSSGGRRRFEFWEIEQYARIAHGGGEGGTVVQAAVVTGRLRPG